MPDQKISDPKINTVDLFCGCGGLSLGFETYQGKVRYQTIMALDNEPKAVLCYNTNLGAKKSQNGIARVCDLTWFGHPVEALLYYLDQYSRVKNDVALNESLESAPICFPHFLRKLRALDDGFIQQCKIFADSQEYKSAWSRLDPATFSLATCIATFTRLGLQVPRADSLSPSRLLWSAPLFDPEPTHIPSKPLDDDEVQTIPELSKALTDEWQREIDQLTESSQKRGRGQHRVVPARLKALVDFLGGAFGTKLRAAWLSWRSQRDSLRLQFVLRNSKQLSDLYTDERRVRLLLGGPPCKGFSRMGRPQIASLRDQGVHAWIDLEYGDQRNALMHKYVLFLEALRPNVFLFENVRNFESVLKTPSGQLDAAALLGEAIKNLTDSEIEYSVHSQILNTRFHGIPQDRQRFIMVGLHINSGDHTDAEKFFSLKKYPEEVPLLTALQGLSSPGEFRFADPTSCGTDHRSAAYTFLDPGMPEPQRRFVEWIRQRPPGTLEEPRDIDAHIYRQPRADDLAIYERFAPGKRWMDYKLRKSTTLRELAETIHTLLKFLSENRSDAIKKDLPTLESVKNLYAKTDEALLLRLMIEDSDLPAWFGDENHLLSGCYLQRGHDQHGDWFERLSATRPCKTIVAHIGKDTYGFIHPWEARPITMREAARIQTFPDWFSFGMVGVVDGYSMIGNAVPCLLAYRFAEKLSNLHEEKSIFVNDTFTPQPGRTAQPPRVEQPLLWESAMAD